MSLISVLYLVPVCTCGLGQMSSVIGVQMEGVRGVRSGRKEKRGCGR